MNIKVLLSSILFFCLFQIHAQTTFGLKIQEVSNDGSNYIISLQMQMMGDTPADFQLGSSSLQFTFPNNALSNPILESTTLVSPFPYFEPTVTVPLIDQCSFNVELSVQDGGMTIATAPAWTELGQINFTIDNINQLVPLSWSYNGGTTQTVVYLDDDINQIFAASPSEDFLIFEPLEVSSDPTFTYIPADATFECSETIPDEMATASASSADCENVSVTFTDDQVADGCGFLITRTFTALDECGNSSTVVQMISVVDTEAPVFDNPPANATYQCMSEVPDLEDLEVTDCNEVVTVESSATMVGACPTVIVRTWTATDGCGNSSEYTQTINVEDTTSPEFVTFPEDMNLTCDDDVPAVVDPTYSDNCDDDLTVDYVENISGECPLGMTITRTWTITDDCGNESMQTQTIQFSSTDNITALTNELFSVNLFPNPMQNSATLEINSDINQEIAIEVYTVLGELVYQDIKPINNGNTQIELDLYNNQSGTYLVKVIDQQQVIVSSLIKE